MSRRFYRPDLVISRPGAGPEVRRIRELEEENRKLRQLVSVQTLVIQSMRETLLSRVDLRKVRNMAELIRGNGLGRLQRHPALGVGRPSPRCKADPEGSVSQITRVAVPDPPRRNRV